MKKNLKAILKKKQLSIGSWITLSDTSTAEIMAKAGFDWLTIDMEHSAITLSEAHKLIQVIDLCGIPALVRVGENSPNIIKRVMDSGAHGVIVPMVNSKEEAIKAVKSVKYPPKGNRGVGLARAHRYGLTFNQYKKWLDTESVVIVQIEHIDAVKNLREILSVDGIDGFIVGPYDLSGPIGIPGKLDSPKLSKILKEIMKVAKGYNITPGFHVADTDANKVIKKKREGYRFIGYSLDAQLLTDVCKDSITKIRKGV